MSIPGVPDGAALSELDQQCFARMVQQEREARRANVAGILDYRLFDAIVDAVAPPNHAALEGGIARWDWPGWNKYAPPLGPGCSCVLIAIGRGRVRKMMEAGEGFDLQANVPEGAGPDAGWDRPDGWWFAL